MENKARRSSSKPPVPKTYANIRLLRIILLSLVSVLLVVTALFIRYILQPAPLPELLPDGRATYAPHYLFSIYGVNKPVGVALSPDGERLYVSESGGERLIHIYHRDGYEIGTFAPQSTKPGERAPTYLATNPDGLVYVADRTQHGIYVFDSDGATLDILLSPKDTLRDRIPAINSAVFNETHVSYNIFQGQISYTTIGQAPQSIELPEETRNAWAPLGLRFGQDGSLFVTNVSQKQDCIYRIDHQGIYPKREPLGFGNSGQRDDQLYFPNVAMPDSQGRVYISDGNNWRISVWDSTGNFLYHFGRGTDDMSVKLPRGLFVDYKDRLYVVDAVDHKVKVFDVSGEKPQYLFEFGELGVGDGLFQYPNDIVVDNTGRLYVADRENNRIQVWSF